MFRNNNNDNNNNFLTLNTPSSSFGFLSPVPTSALGSFAISTTTTLFRSDNYLLGFQPEGDDTYSSSLDLYNSFFTPSKSATTPFTLQKTIPLPQKPIPLPQKTIPLPQKPIPLTQKPIPLLPEIPIPPTAAAATTTPPLPQQKTIPVLQKPIPLLEPPSLILPEIPIPPTATTTTPPPPPPPPPKQSIPLENQNNSFVSILNNNLISTPRDNADFGFNYNDFVNETDFMNNLVSVEKLSSPKEIFDDYLNAMDQLHTIDDTAAGGAVANYRRKIKLIIQSKITKIPISELRNFEVKKCKSIDCTNIIKHVYYSSECKEIVSFTRKFPCLNICFCMPNFCCDCMIDLYCNNIVSFNAAGDNNFKNAEVCCCSVICDSCRGLICPANGREVTFVPIIMPPGKKRKNSKPSSGKSGSTKFRFPSSSLSDFRNRKKAIKKKKKNKNKKSSSSTITTSSSSTIAAAAAAVITQTKKKQSFSINRFNSKTTTTTTITTVSSSPPSSPSH